MVLTQEAVYVEVVADDPGEEAGERGHVEHHKEEEGGEVERGVDPVPGKILHLLSTKNLFSFSEISIISKLNIDTDHALCCWFDFLPVLDPDS